MVVGGEVSIDIPLVGCKVSFKTVLETFYTSNRSPQPSILLEINHNQKNP